MSASMISGCNCGSCASCAGSTPDSALPGRRGLVVPGRTHGQFKQRLLETMAADHRLAGLSTRADDDPAVALADAWSASLHVLSFYLERYHGHSYLDTSDDLGAVDALARMVGYAPAPAISASTTLSFRIDDARGGPASTRIARGSKVQTVPTAGEQPVLFETSAEIEARPVWNELPARRREKTELQLTQSALRITQTVIAARPGDAIAVIKATEATAGGGFHFAHARIDGLDPRPLDPIAYQLIRLDGPWTMVPANAPMPDPDYTIAVFSRRASLFGYNAPTFRLLSKDVRERIVGIPFPAEDEILPTNEKLRQWPHFKARVHAVIDTVPQPPFQIDLDAAYPEAYRGRYIMLIKGGTAEVFKILAVDEVARTDFGISSRVSRLTIDRDPDNWDDDVRNTAVLLQTESVSVAESPITTPAPSDTAPDRVELEVDCDLPVGRVVIVQGIGKVSGDAASQDELRAEVAHVQRVENRRTIVFTQALRHRYQPQSLTVLGNAVAATHGETKMLPAAQGDIAQVLPEIIGSGDARLRFQAFALRQGPLTFVPAANARGYEAALEVQVDAEQRPRVDTLFRQSEQSRGYTLEAAPDGKTLVRFAGRLRTAPNNVGAIYRVGGGSSGNLARGRLVLPLSMPLGLREVTNPVPAEGGADREDIASARRNAPIRAVTLDRIVSLGDYEAFARAFGGISKALAMLIWSSGRQMVHLTVAAAGGTSVAPGSDLYRHLWLAITQASAPGRGFRLLDYTARTFKLSLALLSDPAFMRADVERAVQTAIGTAYSASRRDFGAPVAKSQLLACAQACPGVVAARIVELRDHFDAIVDGDILGAAGATDNAGAELLMLHGDGVSIQGMTP
jgi:hypothetical protein